MLRPSSLVLLALLLAAAVAAAETLRGRVVSLADGDTLTVLDSNHHQHRVRLQGIDAPESVQTFGKVSKHHLSTLVAGREVTVEYSKFDRYGRRLCSAGRSSRNA